MRIKKRLRIEAGESNADRYPRGMQTTDYRNRLADYIRAQALPPDKFSHQPRLYRTAVSLAEGCPFDDDVLYAAVWLHDLGVFVGHRPENPSALAAWDNTAYAMREAPGILAGLAFPTAKIPLVVEVIRTHQPSGQPTCIEGVLMRDADILEQLGAVGMLRLVSKVGRDTRFIRFSDALNLLQRNAEELPKQLRLESARRLAAPRVKAMESFLAAAADEATGIAW